MMITFLMSSYLQGGKLWVYESITIHLRLIRIEI